VTVHEAAIDTGRSVGACVDQPVGLRTFPKGNFPVQNLTIEIGHLFNVISKNFKVNGTSHSSLLLLSDGTLYPGQINSNSTQVPVAPLGLENPMALTATSDLAIDGLPY
jgi:hypothetical protein